MGKLTDQKRSILGPRLLAEVASTTFKDQLLSPKLLAKVAFTTFKEQLLSPKLLAKVAFPTFNFDCIHTSRLHSNSQVKNSLSICIVL